MSVEKASVFKSMAAGLQFIWQNPIFGILIAMTYFSQFFGWSFQSLFPVFAKDILHVGPDGLGYMNSALGAGSLLGAGMSTSFANVRRRGWLILGGLISQGVILALFAQVPSFAIALGPLVLAGISQSMFNVTAQSTLQYLVPNEYRGRVMGVWGMTYTAVQPSGQLAMGILAGLGSAPWAVTLGGALVLSFTLLVAMTSRRIRSLTLSEPLGPRQEPAHP